MKVALFGAGGMIGQRILDEALRRGHQVTAIVRDPSRMVGKRQGLTVVQGDVGDIATIVKLIVAHDAVVSAIGPRNGQRLDVLTTAAQTFMHALPKAGVKRLLIVGGAGSLEVSPGKQLVDTANFPAAERPVALADREALDVYRRWGRDLDWTYFSPAAEIAPGSRTGKFRLGKDQLLKDEAGRSHISAEDFAVAMIDELENPRHVQQRLTVGY